MRQSRILLARDIFQHPKGVFDFMRRVSKVLLPVLICALAALPGLAQSARNVRVDFKETTLKNGLRVITIEDHSAPVIAISITYNVGTMNGSTNEDRTNYFEALPANQLDLAIFLEADRMKSLAITKDNLDNQRNAVQEERRLGVDNQPYGKSEEVM